MGHDDHAAPDPAAPDLAAPDLAAYVAALSRCPDPAAARPLVASPHAGVRDAALDEDARVAVLRLAPGALRGAFGALGEHTPAPAVPSALGPLDVALYPAGPPAVVAVYGDPHVVAVAVRWPATGPVGDLAIDRATGRITVCRRTVGAATSRFAADALGGRWRDMRNGYAWLDVEHEVPGSGSWLASFSFEGESLEFADLVYVGADEPRGWGSWSREREEAARLRHDAWLDERLGRGPLWGDTRKFPWGRVWSGYDDRSGGSSIVVRYRD